MPDPDAVAGVLARQREYLLRTLRSIGQSRARTQQDPVASLLTTAAELHTQADLALLDAAEARLLRADGTTRTRSPRPATAPADALTAQEA